MIEFVGACIEYEIFDDDRGDWGECQYNWYRGDIDLLLSDDDWHKPSESWCDMTFWLGRPFDEVVSWIDDRVRAIAN